MLHDVRSEARAFFAPLADVIAGRAHWTAFADFEDEVTDLELDGDDLYVLANKDTPRGRLLKTSATAPNLATAADRGSARFRCASKALARARDGIYLRIMDGGISRLAQAE